MENLANSPSYCSPRAEGSLFIRNAISSHLLSLAKEKYGQNHGYDEWVKSVESMADCGKNLYGRKFIKICNCSTSIIPVLHHCNLRTCQECSQIRSRRLKKRFFPFIQHFSTTRGSLNSLYFITIAPRNYENFEQGLNHIKKSWSKFIRTKYIRERVQGGLWIIETKNTGKGWHIHIHAIFYGRRLDNHVRGLCKDCHQHFLKFDRDSNRFYCGNRKCNSLNVVPEKNSKIVELFTSCGNRDTHVYIQELKGGPSSALNYVLKYISVNKDDFQEIPQLAQYIFDTRKQKLINLFGIFFKYRPEKHKHFCFNCGSQIDFIFDLEVVSFYEKGGGGFVDYACL